MDTYTLLQRDPPPFWGGRWEVARNENGWLVAALAIDCGNFLFAGDFFSIEGHSKKDSIFCVFFKREGCFRRGVGGGK